MRTLRPHKLYAVGALTAAVYLAALVFYREGPAAHTRTGKELFAWFICLSLLPLYVWGYRVVSGEGETAGARTVVLFSATFCLLALFTHPFHSTDVFGYVNRGWQQVHYGLNPYEHRLADVPGWREDPMFREHWLYNPTPYGFLFMLLARAVCAAGGGNWWATVLLFKAVNVAAFAGSAWLVWAATRRLNAAGRVRSLYLLTWSPLLLMHHVANGHNDLLTGFFVALALYFAFAGRELWIIPALSAATLLKYGPAVLIPFALVFVVRRKGWGVGLAGCAISAALTVVVTAPYLADWERLRLEDIRDNATLIDNSLHSLLIHLYGTAALALPPLAAGRDEVDAVIRFTLRLGFVAFLVYQFVRLPRDFAPAAFAEKALLVLFVLICVISSKFNAWYLGMLLPAALMLEEGRALRRVTVAVSGGELLSLTFFKQAYMLNYFAMVLVPAWLVYRQVKRERAAESHA